MPSGGYGRPNDDLWERRNRFFGAFWFPAGLALLAGGAVTLLVGAARWYVADLTKRDRVKRH